MSHRTLLLAHRGDHRAAPENTLAAFRAAVDAGLDGVELDVRASADGEAVVIHDPTLDRVQWVAERVDRLPARRLAQLGVPRLGDVFAALPPTAMVDVELKEPVVSAVRDVVREARGSDAAGVVCSSFDERTLVQLGRLEPTWARWLITASADGIDRAVALDCRGAALEWRAIDRSTVARARRLGTAIVGWTVRDRATRDRLAGLGVDALCVEGAAVG